MTDKPTPRQLSGHLAVQLVVRVVGLASGIITAWGLARGLSHESFGVFGLILTVVGMTAVLSDLGMTTAAVRTHAVHPSRATDTAGALLIGKTITGFLSFTVSAVALSVLLSQGDLWAGLVVATSQLLTPLSANLAWAQASLKVGTQNALLLLQGTLWPASVLLLMIRGGGMMAYALAFLVASAVYALTAFLLFRRHLRPTFGRLMPTVTSLFKLALPMAVASIFITAYYRIGGVIVFQSHGAGSAADFSAAFRLLDAFQVLPATLLTVVLPLLSQQFRNDSPRNLAGRQRLFDLAVRVTLGLALPVAAGCAVLSTQIIQLIYGASFSGSSSVLVWLMAAFPAICAGWVFTNVLLASGRTRNVAMISISVAVVSTLTSFVAIPRGNATTAAVITFCTELVVAFTLSVAVTRHARVAVPWSRLARLLLATVLMTALVYPFRDRNLLWVIPFGAMVYGVLVIAMRGLRLEDLRVVLSRQKLDSQAS